MTIDEMKEKKTELGLTSLMISRTAGIPLSTVQKIMSGATKAPRKATLEAIEGVLQAEDRRRKERLDTGSVCYPDHSSVPVDLLCESGPAYQTRSSQGGRRRYTLDDYYAIPDERRVELIDGVIYDMGAPAVIHQKILGELYLLFRECMDAHEGACEVYLSPCDVQLDRDIYTMVQPDLLVICREYDLGAKAFEGAPDLTVEILSPSTRSKDMLLKLYKYQNAGVKEYWIIDPDHETVLVYNFQEESLYPEKYDFDSVIPIHISGGSCSIDFSRIHQALKKAGGR